MSGNVTVLVELRIAGLAPSHRGILTATDDFITYVNEATGITLLDGYSIPAQASKGALEQIALSVGSPAAIVAICRLWLQRDRSRSIHIKFNIPDQPPTEITATGEQVSLKTLQHSIDSALRSGRASKNAE